MKHRIILGTDPCGEDILSRPAAAVDTDNKIFMRALVVDLQDTAAACERPSALGLSAHQIGRPVRAFVIRRGNKYIPIINPQVVRLSKKTTTGVERCLSWPGRDGVVVVRHKEILIEYYNLRTDSVCRATFKNLEARVVQHELNHLAGVLV